MQFLPVVERELRVAARRRGTYWSRLGAALLAVLVVGWFLVVSDRSGTAEGLGKGIFVTLVVLAFLYSLLAGVRNTADCISEEKREGTLGLLFLTDLKGVDVLLGKLAATSLNSLYGLLAIFPVLALPLLLGGTTFVQFGAALLLLLNTLLFSLVAGLCVSTLVRGERASLFCTLFLLAFICVGWPLVGVFAQRFIFGAGAGMHDTWFDVVFAWVSPLYACGEFLGSWDKPRLAEGFWTSLLATQLVTWCLLGVAHRQLPRVWQDRSVTPQAAGWGRRWQQWAYGRTEQRVAYRRQLMEANPVFWLGARNRLKPAWVWSVLGLGFCLWFSGALASSDNWLDSGYSFLGCLLLTSLLKGWVAVEAAHRFCQDRQSGALELLLSTPFTVPEILAGQVQALRRQFFWPAMAVLILHALLVSTTRDSSGLVTWWLAAMAMFVADLVALAYVGMWLGLNTRHATRAALGTVARILVLPWVILIGLLTLLAVGARGSAGARFEDLFIGLWLTVGLITSFVFATIARDGLLHRLRDLAADRFDRAPAEQPPSASVPPPRP